MMKLRTLALIPIAAVALAGCGTPAPAHSSAVAGAEVKETPTPSSAGKITVLASLDLNQTGGKGKVGDPCEGLGGYADIRRGAQVRISDSTGKIVYIGSLGQGTMQNTIPSLGFPDVCQFWFMDSVPDTGDSIYGIEVANRGIVNFQTDNPVVQLSLGS